MARLRLLAALAVVVVLALPVAALAGSAGDNQYSDPFGNSSPTQTQTTTPSAPAPSQPVATPTASTQPTATTASGSSGQLPRTGLDLRVVGGAGVLLIAGGLLLRRKLARSS